MKKSCKLLCMLLAFVMMLSLSVSCGGEDTPPTEEPEEEQQGTAIPPIIDIIITPKQLPSSPKSKFVTLLKGIDNLFIIPV